MADCCKKILASVVLMGFVTSLAFAGSMTDPRDEKTYKTVTINGQEWMAENINFKTPGRMCYQGKPANCKKYGSLYKREEALKVCPSGWHLPSKEEYNALIAFAGGEEKAGDALKAKKGWNPNEKKGNGSDKYGFAILPAGAFMNSPDEYTGEGMACIWTSTSSQGEDGSSYCALETDDIYGMAYVECSVDENDGYSVRCIKD